MTITKSTISSSEAIHLFSLHDDFIVGFLGADSKYYTRYSVNENISDVWIAYCDGNPIGCAAYRIKAPSIGEHKRMFIKGEYRGRGISKQLLASVENHAESRCDRVLHLSTRVTLEPAVTLYRKSGFIETFRDGLYVEMEKKLSISNNKT